MIDIATLTGACVVASGGVRAAAFSRATTRWPRRSRRPARARRTAAGALPLDDDYAEGLKTNFADVANVAGRAGGARSSARQVPAGASRPTSPGPTDIAGTALEERRGQGLDRPTGRPAGLVPHAPRATARPAPARARRKPRPTESAEGKSREQGGGSQGAFRAVTDIGFHYNAPDKLSYAPAAHRPSPCAACGWWWSARRNGSTRSTPASGNWRRPTSSRPLPRRCARPTCWRARR